MAGYANPNALVETDWLGDHLDDEGIRVVEVDEDVTAYEKGHLRGAVGWNWTTDLHTKVGVVRERPRAELLSTAGVAGHDRGPVWGTTTGSPPTPTGS
jgi:3-mercaptopyruvate sulfurtransferase SseA